MNKRSILLMLILCLLAASPVFLSMKAGDAYRILSDHVAQSGYIILQNDQFNHGYINSSASATVRINWDNLLGDRSSELNEAFKTLDFKVSHEIRHGPFPQIMTGNFRLAQALIITRLDLTDEARNKLAGLYPDSNPIVFLSWIEFSGDSLTEIRATPFSTSTQQGTMSWKGLTGHINYFPEQTRMQSRIASPSLSYRSKTGDILKISGVHLSSDTRQNEAGINTGDISFTLAEASLSTTPEDSTPVEFQLKQLASTSKTRINDHKVSSSATFTARELTLGNQQYGPATYDISVGGLDVRTLKSLQQEIAEISQSNVPAEQKKILFAGKALVWLPRLLEQEPTLDINKISFNFNGEESALKARARVNSNLLTRDAPPLLLLQALNIQADFTIPKSLLAAVPRSKPRLSLSTDNTVMQSQAQPTATQRMDRLVQQGYFKTDGRFYHSKLVFSQGKLLLNGQEFNPALLAY